MNNKEIIKYLINNGVKPTLLGFIYLYDAIEITIANNNIIPKVADLCKTIADKYHTSKAGVTMAMRNAIASSSGKLYNLSIATFVVNASIDISLGME